MVAPLESLEPGGPTAGFAARRRSADVDVDMQDGDLVPARPLNVITHLHDEERALTLKIKLPPTWDDRTVSEAIVAPFVAAYDEKHPDHTASAQGPFSRVKVLVWSGPRPCAADRYSDELREGAEDIRLAEQPIHGLLDVSEPVSALRNRAHNRLKPTVEVELVQANSTALVLRTVPSTGLLAPGERLIAMLGDTSADPEEMDALVDAAIAGGELAYLGLTAARDRNGRNPLHLAATRGDATLCRKLLRRREDVFAMDSNRDTALHVAAMAGRQLIVRDLLDLGALIHEKNRDLMLPLNLAVVDEAQGNGEVVRMLVEHGADIDAKCWDVTPMMAAAAGGHHWAIDVLVELGADLNVRNGYEMMALDYARDMVTSELLYDLMRGSFLPDPQRVREQNAWRERRRQHAARAGSQSSSSSLPGMEEKAPRLFQAQRHMPLRAAFAALSLDDEWLAPFTEMGEHYKAIRYTWRAAVLRCHPDRQPSGQSDELQAENTAEYMKAMAAFEAIDAHYASRFAERAPSSVAAQAAAAPPPSAAAEPPGPAATPTGAAATTSAAAATARAARPLLLRQRVEVMGLQAKPEFNGRVGTAVHFDRAAGRYTVELERASSSRDEGGGEKPVEKALIEKLKVREANLRWLSALDEQIQLS